MTIKRYNQPFHEMAGGFMQEHAEGEYVKWEDVEKLAAENVALKKERSSMEAIGELIRTQDNRITDQPFFAVMVKREIFGSEDHDYDRICWVENRSGDYIEATETQHRRLEAKLRRICRSEREKPSQSRSSRGAAVSAGEAGAITAGIA